MATPTNSWKDWAAGEEPTSIKLNLMQPKKGAAADKAAVPTAGMMYIATDTGKVYVCFSAGAWVDVSNAEAVARASADSGKIDTSAIDTDGTLAANSDSKLASQKATKTYVSTITAIVSANLRNSNDAAAQTSLQSYTKIKEILLNEPLAAARIDFLADANGTGYFKIYKNGVAIGTEQTVSATTGTKTENFASLNAVAGDLIQIYAYSNHDYAYARASNFRLYYDQQITKIGGKTLSSALTVTDAISTTNNS